MKYLLENITYKNGQERTDDRYPNRIGSIVRFNNYPVVGHSLCFRYVKYDNYSGERIEDHITITSKV